MLRIPAKGARDTLFRACVPDNGAPVSLDLFGEEPELCDSEQQLEVRVLDFLAYIRDRMAAYREYAQS